jgi:hypothetical protein
MENEVKLWFDHGLGDCCQFIALLQLYKQRGYEVKIHYEENKKDLWKAGGIEYWEECCENYHHWIYAPEFNHPDPAREGTGNKVFYNFNTDGLPYIGKPEELWQELCEVNLEGSFELLITPELKEQVSRFLDHCPTPIVCLHPKGTNWPDKKNLPDDVTKELYGLLLDGMPGTIVLLDWDYRVPLVPHSRIRHIKRDWGHLSVLQLAALLEASDLLIGVDSGPWHLSNFTRTPALGVFHDFFPWCVSLPRPSGLNAVLTRDSHSHCTRERRKHWNPIEYSAPKPRANDIAKHALRMLAGSRYGLPIGRDVMLQHLIRDKNKASTGTSPIADRNNTLDFLFCQLPQYEAPEIVETGCVRSPDDWGAGFFGYLAGAWLHKRKGTLTSVDLDLNHLNKARDICRDWKGNFIFSDSVAYLKARETPIDVLYLDSLDCDMPNHADHALAEFQAAENKLTNKSLVIYDDTVYAGQWQGKGAKAIPYMLDKGWKIQASGYQTILTLQPTSR